MHLRRELTADFEEYQMQIKYKNRHDGGFLLPGRPETDPYSD
jgi:hypothetical protein